MLNRLFLSGLILVLLSACGKQETSSEPTIKIRPAKLVTVSQASSSRSLSFPAIVEAEEAAELTFQVGGKIVVLDVLEGDEVNKGQIIARVEERDFQNSLSQAQAQFDNAETEYQRAVRLAEQDAVSQSVLETRKTNRDVAKAALDTAKKASSNTILRAPFSGYISKVHVERHQNIQAGSPIANIQSKEVVASINVPADLVARTPQFTPINTRVVLDAALNDSFPAVFKEAAGQADPASQTYSVSFRFSSPDNLAVLPGMTGKITTDFEFNNTSDIVPSGIAIPISSVIAEGDNLFVWRVDQNTMKISKTTISTGIGMQKEEVIVLTGLNSGDVIVAAGGSFLHDGMTIRAWEAK